MQTVHVTAYAVRTLRGNYVKTDSGDGIGYALFNTKAEAKEWAEEQGKEDCFTTKVRIAITPIDSGRTDRLVAVQKARPKMVPETQQEFKF
jgi:hypothetical protein